MTGGLAPETVRAIWISSLVGLAVQVIALVIVRSFGRERLLVGWGMGTMLRLVVLVGYALVGVPMLGIPLVPAMLTLASVFFVTLMIEPFLLPKK